MRAVYVLLAILGLTKALPGEFLPKLDVDSIKEALTELNEDAIKETLNKLYVDHFRDTVIKLDAKQIKEQLLDSKNQKFLPIEPIILQLLESARGILVNGTDTIPVLDPFKIDKIHIGDSILPSPSYITINDLTIKDLSTFVAEELKVSSIFLRQRIDFNIVIPAVNINSNSYDLSLIIFGGPIFGKGDMHFKIVKPRVYGHIIFGIRISGSGLSLVLHDGRIQISLASFEPVITGLFNDKTISDFVAAFLRNLVPEMLEFFEEDITDILTRTTLHFGNLILSDLNLGDLLPMS